MDELVRQFAYGPLDLRPGPNAPTGATLERLEVYRIGIPPTADIQLPPALVAQIRDLAEPHFGGAAEEQYGTPSGWANAQIQKWRTVLQLRVAGPRHPLDGLLAIENTFANELARLRADGQLKLGREAMVRGVMALHDGSLATNILTAVANQQANAQSAPDGTPGETAPAEAGMSSGAKVGLALGGAGLAGAAIWYVTRGRKKGRGRRR